LTVVFHVAADVGSTDLKVSVVNKRIIGVAGCNILSFENTVIAHRAAVNSRIAADNQLSGCVIGIADNQSLSVITVTGRAVVQDVNGKLAIFDNHLTAGTSDFVIGRGNTDIEFCKMSLRCSG